jgi:hypothetical protein
MMGHERSLGSAIDQDDTCALIVPRRARQKNADACIEQSPLYYACEETGANRATVVNVYSELARREHCIESAPRRDRRFPRLNILAWIGESVHAMDEINDHAGHL